MTMPPAGPNGPALWMTISDVFYIRGRGTVVTGLLEGNVPLNLGDTLVCDDGSNWEVGGIEQFRRTLSAAEPGTNIGILLRDGPPGDVLRGRTVTFARGRGVPGAHRDSGVPGAPSRKRRWFR